MILRRSLVSRVLWIDLDAGVDLVNRILGRPDLGRPTSGAEYLALEIEKSTGPN
jgi:hypothetical protein